ncbi:hypothetical protein [Actinomadura opuntiae]|uniref:hypothetical protein n=1 Tax=Actinomadura sp. OS1-43 TaxID=604315 RepID=UPI00255B342B|nr:hypothetical protein [Actinomadura sp. OS1-43]MDL4813127.1 hypothetical protein [Actinomadura sp. OS1-43]
MNDGIVFDHHAVLALGRGHRALSGLVHAAHTDPYFVVSVPAVCLATAVRQRPEMSVHLAQLAAVEVPALDRVAADETGRMAARLWPAEGWPVLHAVTVALLTGWEIATAQPEDYRGFGVPLLPITRPDR